LKKQENIMIKNDSFLLSKYTLFFENKIFKLLEYHQKDFNDNHYERFHIGKSINIITY